MVLRPSPTARHPRLQLDGAAPLLGIRLMGERRVGASAKWHRRLRVMSGRTSLVTVECRGTNAASMAPRSGARCHRDRSTERRSRTLRSRAAATAHDRTMGRCSCRGLRRGNRREPWRIARPPRASEGGPTAAPGRASRDHQRGTWPGGSRMHPTPRPQSSWSPVVRALGNRLCLAGCWPIPADRRSRTHPRRGTFGGPSMRTGGWISSSRPAVSRWRRWRRTC